jgi:uncharacterized protein (TIRG00374 family)
MRVGRSGRLWLGALAAVLLLALFFHGIDPRALGAAIRSAHPGYLLASMLVTVLMYACRAWRWGFLLAPLTRARFADLFSATVVGFMSGLAIPRAGEVVRPYLIARRQGFPASAGFASIILERLIDLMTMLLLFGLYLYVLPTPELELSGAGLHVVKAGGAAAGLTSLAVLAVLIAFHLHAERAMAVADRLLARLPARLGAPAGRMLRQFGEGLAVLKAPGSHLLAICLQSLGVWLLIALSLWLVNLAFGIDLPFRTTFLMLAFLTVGVAVPTPGMVGGFHESYKLSLKQPFGIDENTAAAAGILSHVLNNLPVLVGGLLLLRREGLTFGKVAQVSEEAER